jgi:hypothetical protein
MRKVFIALIIIAVAVVALSYGLNSYFQEQLLREKIKIYNHWSDTYVNSKREAITAALKENSIATNNLTEGINELYRKIRSNETITFNSDINFNFSFCYRTLVEWNCNASFRISNLNATECRNPELFCKNQQLYILTDLASSNSLANDMEHLGSQINNTSKLSGLVSATLLNAFSLARHGIEDTALTSLIRDNFNSCIESFNTKNITQHQIDICNENVTKMLETIATEENSKIKYTPRLGFLDCEQNVVPNQIEGLQQNIYNDLQVAGDPVSKIYRSLEYRILTDCNRDLLNKIKGKQCTGNVMEKNLSLWGDTNEYPVLSSQVATCWTTSMRGNLTAIQQDYLP